MILIASDAASLAESLSRWEWAEYAACALVALACAGEYVAEFTNLLTNGIEERKTRLAKRSTLLLIASLAFELTCLVETNNISGRLIGSLSEKAAAADGKAQSALDKSSIAEQKSTDATRFSKEAVDAASHAKNEADAADNAASTAQKKILAVSSRVEIIDANVGQTQWLMSARRILNPDEVSSELKKIFKGRNVVVKSYIGDHEGDGLCTQLWYIAQKGEMNPENACGSVPLSASPFSTVIISGPDLDETEKIGKLLVQVGKLSFGGTISSVRGPVLTIFVGFKPSFIIGPRQIK